jgi:NAD(P)-dependent dehydrogenase (short-subunit alcohol dehydrogenase family)
MKGRVAVITGSASGLGFAVASRMATEGALVVVADIDGAGGEAAARKLTEAGGRAVAVRTDVSNESDVVALMERAVSEFGRLDILHNNAADLSADTFMHDNGILDMEVDVWDRTMAVNLRGAMLGCKHAIPRMLENGGGVIVNTASVSALIGEVTHVAYACSKAGLIAMTRHVANMFGSQGIRINSVAPGLMLTEKALDRLDERQLAAFRAERLLDKATTPEDAANLVFFLASDQAACITGQTYVLDGGTLAKRPRMAMNQWEQYLASTP